MDPLDQRFAEEVLRRALAKAKSSFDDSGMCCGLSSTTLFESEILAVTGRTTRLSNGVVDSYISYFRSMNAHSNYRVHDACIELLVDVQRTRWPTFEYKDLQSRIVELESLCLAQSEKIKELRAMVAVVT
jgi:hypothetical protein